MACTVGKFRCTTHRVDTEMELGVGVLALVPALATVPGQTLLVKPNLATVRGVGSKLHRLTHHTEESAVEGVVVIRLVKLIVITREGGVGFKPGHALCLVDLLEEMHTVTE